MESITLSVSPARRGSDYTVELFRWRNGVREEKAAAKEVLQAALFAKGGVLDIGASQKFFLETQSQDPGFPALGRQMWDALHTGAIGTKWDEAIREVKDAIDQWQALSASDKAATPRPSGLRTYLQVDESLAAVPWELLRSTHDLFLIENMPLLRAEKRTFLPRSDAAVWPIRVLVVVGASAAEAATLKADEELEEIRAIFREAEHLFDLNIIETRNFDKFTPARLKGQLDSFLPHIFHFIGHGRTDANSPRLEICDRNSKHDWTSGEIELAVRNMGSVLRLAFLNACRTGEPEKSDFFSIARAFFEGGTLAVLSMQADVSGQAARTCTQRFYRELVSGKHVDTALASARDMVQAEAGPETRHAFVPVLSVRAAPEHILACPPRAPVKAAGLDDVRKFFVDRIEERRLAIHAIARSEILKQHWTAIVLKGQEEKVGKTWLQVWLLHALAQRSHSIHAVDAFDKGDWLQFVIALCEGASGSDAFAQPLPLNVRRRFYEDVARLAGLNAPPEGSRPAFALKDFDARNDAPEKVLAAFHQALREHLNQVPGQDFVLAVSRISTTLQSLSPAHVRTLKVHLWDKIAADTAGRIKIIVELPFDPRGDYNLEFAEDFWGIVNLKKFSADMVPDLLKEFFCRRNPDKQWPPELKFDKFSRDILPVELTSLVSLPEGM